MSRLALARAVAGGLAVAASVAFILVAPHWDKVGDIKVDQSLRGGVDVKFDKVLEPDTLAKLPGNNALEGRFEPAVDYVERAFALYDPAQDRRIAYAPDRHGDGTNVIAPAMPPEGALSRSAMPGSIRGS